MEIKELYKDKKAQIGRRITSVAIVVISIIVLFQIFSELVPEAQAGGDRFVSDACGDAGCSFDTSTRICEINSSSEGEGIVCPNAVNSPPLSTLFSGTGIVIILVMVGLLLVALRLTLFRNR